MGRKGVFATSLGTVGCAVAIGYVMQNTGTSSAGSATLDTAPIERTVLRSAAVHDESSDKLPLKAIKLTSAQAALPPLSGLTRSLTALPASFDTGTVTVPRVPADPVMPYLGCAITVDARVSDMANVALDVTAPCNRNERVTVHHTGMMFTTGTTEQGTLSVTIPAMREAAVFMVEFDNGKGAVASVNVPALNQVERVAVQWSGDTGFQVHAREFGAEYGSEGHAWSGVGVSTSGASVVRLGDPKSFSPKLVEIYTFPTDGATRSGTVSLTVEAEVTQKNCGRDIAAQSIELREDAMLRTQDLVLSMPDCSAVGDFLVLNNLVDDLKIAAR